MKFGLALLRTVIGALFLGHGLQKLTGWFGGHGPEGTGQFFESIGLNPGRRHAIAAGASEVAGGALLAAGLLTPMGASLISGTMITAVRKVHWPNGPWSSDGGYEYNLALLAAVFALTDVGPGEWSLDERLGLRTSGPLWALAQLAAGAAGSYAVTTIGGAPSAQASEPEAQAAAPEAGAEAVAAGRFRRDDAPEAPVPASPAVPSETLPAS